MIIANRLRTTKPELVVVRINASRKMQFYTGAGRDEAMIDIWSSNIANAHVFKEDQSVVARRMDEIPRSPRDGLHVIPIDLIASIVDWNDDVRAEARRAYRDSRQKSIKKRA